MNKRNIRKSTPQQKYESVEYQQNSPVRLQHNYTNFNKIYTFVSAHAYETDLKLLMRRSEEVNIN